MANGVQMRPKIGPGQSVRWGRNEPFVSPIAKFTVLRLHVIQQEDQAIPLTIATKGSKCKLFAKRLSPRGTG